MSSDEPQSLSALYEAAESKRSELEAIPSALHPSYTSTLSETIALYTQCLEQISAVSLFSPNESLEDLSTSSLPYLSINFYLADLVQKRPNLSPKERGAALAQSRHAHERFLSTLENYSLISPPHDRLLERYRDDEARFQVISTAGDPQKRRDAKIQNYRMEKDLKDRLATLKRNPRYVEEGGDDEIVRDVWLADLKYKVHLTFAALEGLGLEEGMLAMAPPEIPRGEDGQMLDGREELRGGQAGNDDARLDTPLVGGLGRGGPLLSKQGKPLQPFTLVGSRQELARGVFRPGHNLPTMSIDEYLEEEKKRGGIIEGGEQPKVQVDEDDMENADRETYKAREWDEYVDANPKGSGNTLNMG